MCLLLLVFGIPVSTSCLIKYSFFQVKAEQVHNSVSSGSGIAKNVMSAKHLLSIVIQFAT
jgi:hypothetical protein